jgi:hypothetical protein
MDVANRLLAEAAPDVVPTQSVRVDGRAPEIVPVDGDEAVVAEVRRRTGELADAWSSVGVVAPEPFFARLQDGADNVTVVLPDQAKGLEFDAVVVVEPAAIAHAGAGSRGLRLLYVALTRAVQELVVVHTRPLPRSLGLEPASAQTAG